jgi:hypothetical protein
VALLEKCRTVPDYLHQSPPTPFHNSYEFAPPRTSTCRMVSTPVCRRLRGEVCACVLSYCQWQFQSPLLALLLHTDTALEGGFPNKRSQEVLRPQFAIQFNQSDMVLIGIIDAVDSLGAPRKAAATLLTEFRIEPFRIRVENAFQHLPGSSKADVYGNLYCCTR